MPKKPTMTPTAATYDRKAYMAAMRERQRGEGKYRCTLNLDAGERARMQQSADSHGESFATHLKRRAFADLDAVYIVPPALDADLSSLLGVVRGIGNNVNQMAKHSNELQAVLSQNDLLMELKRLNDLVRAFVRQPERAP
jgi:Bacterial mobilisation protein (MobC)